MNDKILREAEAICGIMFPDDEASQCLLHHHLALFADYVEVQSLLKFRSEIDVSYTYPADRFAYKPEDIRHG